MTHSASSVLRLQPGRVAPAPRFLFAVLFPAALILFGTSCGGTGTDATGAPGSGGAQQTGTGGSGARVGSGGASSSGGLPAGTGGRTTGSGGLATGSGGGPGSGGGVGTGGTSATGGNHGTGGTVSTGGNSGSGGLGSGGAVSTGGARAAGGTTGVGGRPGSGTGGGPATGGGVGTGGSAPPGGTGGGTGDQPIGWASVNALGNNGTTGGNGGPEVMVTTCAALKTAVARSGAAIVTVSGRIVCDDVAVSSNKSVIGLPGAALIATPGTSNHLLVLQNVSNIIVRNLVMQGAGVTAGNKSAGDTFHIESSVHHVWADHLDISDGDDGNLDITHNCNYITISWTKFHYSSGTRVHRFSNLIAAAVGDSGTYRITFHHNWWADNVDQRSPRAHEGSGGIHLFNNYYSEAGNSYCVGVGQNAIFLSENDYFDGVNVPFNMTPNGETGGQILSRGDVFHNTSGNQAGTNKGFTPPYAYTLDPAADVPALVQGGAGATLK